MPDFIFIRASNRFEKINFAEILYVEALKNYSRIHKEEGAILTLAPLRMIESALPADRFIRIHRSYVVSLDKMIAFDKKCVWLPGGKIPIGDHYRGSLDKFVISYDRGRRSAQEPGDYHFSILSR